MLPDMREDTRKDKNSDLIYERSTKKVSGGSFVLCHPTEHTLEALPKILKYYADNGFTASTVSENLKIN